MRAVARRVEHPGVGIEDLTEAPAGVQGVPARIEGVSARPVHGLVLVGHGAHHEGAHERRVVAAVGTGEFDGELVPLREPAPPGLVPAEQRVGPGAEDERVSGILAAAAEDRPCIAARMSPSNAPGAHSRSASARASSASSAARRT